MSEHSAAKRSSCLPSTYDRQISRPVRSAPAPAARTPGHPNRSVTSALITDLETAGEILGIGRTLAYDLARNNDFPTRLIRLGRRDLGLRSVSSGGTVSTS